MYIFEICQQGKKSVNQNQKKIIGSTEIEVHSVANDGLYKVQDFIKKYRL